MSLCLLHFCLSQISLCFSPIRELVIGFGAHPGNPGWSHHLKILNLIRSTKILFPSKVTFTGSRDLEHGHSFWVATIQTTASSDKPWVFPNQPKPFRNSKSKAHPPYGLTSCVCLERIDRMINSQVNFHLCVGLIMLFWALDGLGTKYVFSKENLPVITVLLLSRLLYNAWSRKGRSQTGLCFFAVRYRGWCRAAL